MHWGIRRYQNPDGTLTDLGRKRIGSKNDRRMYKMLKRQIHRKRAKIAGGSNRWLSGTPIGENSRKLLEESDKKRREYESSKEYKSWLKEYDAFERKSSRDIDKGKMSIEEYDNKQRELYNKRPVKNFSDPKGWAATLTSKGWRFADDYINKGGADLSVAYLKDLGYENEDAKRLVKRLAKQHKTLGDL